MAEGKGWKSGAKVSNVKRIPVGAEGSNPILKGLFVGFH